MSTPTHICPACELTQFAGDGFCNECGTALVLARYCEECGVLITHAKEFCRECGARVPPAPSAEPPRAAKRLTDPTPSTPQWMKDPEPEPARPTPQWMKDPEPEPARPPRRKKSTPIATPPPAPAVARPAPTTDAPLQRRAPAALVPMRSTLPVPYKPSSADNVRALVSVGMGVVASVTMMGGPIPLAIILFVMMFIVGGTRLRHEAANAIGGFIDWLWEDPVLRRRLLGE
ncbi:MAG: hypothetical protein H0T73_00310 [Ardenticatenales bacterium]|nr:hypothetical protein [Ardenticatenales bacterium]